MLEKLKYFKQEFDKRCQFFPTADVKLSWVFYVACRAIANMETKDMEKILKDADESVRIDGFSTIIH